MSPNLALLLIEYKINIILFNKKNYFIEPFRVFIVLLYEIVLLQFSLLIYAERLNKIYKNEYKC